ncbi:Conserved_hypothetical protein [Hexamita inflata]|uniref:Uncharacterized protein n=1 Tax=Hexamita inflata TaxID=28002 RepID=A0AA86NWT6_9EUKA|nr:Conserved hypothetical protein [Hexamita inflata]CAI9969462.1 Conserved hypothetical protein [Hexamita inflata]
MDIDINLDEVEASIKRCEDFISNNEFNMDQLRQQLQIPQNDICYEEDSPESVNEDEDSFDKQQTAIRLSTNNLNLSQNAPFKKQPVSQNKPQTKLQQQTKNFIPPKQQTVNQQQVIQKQQRQQKIETQQKQKSVSPSLSPFKRYEDQNPPPAPKPVQTPQVQQEQSQKLSQPSSVNRFVKQMDKQEVDKVQRNFVVSDPQQSRLMQQKSNKTERKLNELKIQQQERDMKECTFTPQINQKSRLMATQHRVDDYESTLQKREQMRLDKQREEYQECTFKPQINDKSKIIVERKYGDQSVIERASSTKQEKQKKIQEQFALTHKIEEDPNYKQFRDTLAMRSVMKYDPNMASVDVFTRLNKTPIRRKQEIYTQIEEEQTRECIFTPKINTRSKSIANEIGTFEERTKLFNLKKQENVQKIQQEHDKDMIFRPITNQQKVAQATPEIFERLHSEKRKTIQVFQDEETFKPTINQYSLDLTKNRPSIQENALTYKKEQDQRLEQHRQAMIKEREKECTFQPQITKSNQTTMPHYKFDQVDEMMAQIKSEKEYKDIKLANQKRSFEYEKELKHLTEKPEIGTIDKSIYNKVEVKGYQNVIQRKELIEKLENEQKEREDYVFGLKNKSKMPTVPKPFNLTERIENKANEQKSMKKNVGMKQIVDAILKVEV